MSDQRSKRRYSILPVCRPGHMAASYSGIVIDRYHHVNERWEGLSSSIVACISAQFNGLDMSMGCSLSGILEKRVRWSLSLTSQAQKEKALQGSCPSLPTCLALTLESLLSQPVHPEPSVCRTRLQRERRSSAEQSAEYTPFQ